MCMVRSRPKRKHTEMTADANTIRFGALETIFRPIVRFCIRNRVPIQTAEAALRRVFVDVASREIESSGQRVTASQIFLMTGLHRRDVTRIIYGDESDGGGPDVLVRILSRWEKNPEFCNKDGTPKVLSIEGDDSEFRRLVSSVTQNISPATALSELERIKAVESLDSGIKRVKEVALFGPVPDKALALFAKDVDTVARAAEENIYFPQETKNVYLRTEYDNISRADLPKIRKWLYNHGLAFHRSARNYLSKFDNDLNPSLKREGGARVVLSAFSLASTDATERPENMKVDTKGAMKLRPRSVESSKGRG